MKALRRKKMTKLEELRAAYDAARYAELKKQKEKQNDLALSTNEAHGT